MTADTGKVREALALALDPDAGKYTEDQHPWPWRDADALLAGVLSDPAVCAALPGVAGLIRELDEAQEKLARIEAAHVRHHGAAVDYCADDGLLWPCPTHRALDGTP